MRRKRLDPSIIDQLDAKIIALLGADGRHRNTEVAQKLGVGEATVRNRIARLVREEILQFGAWVNPLKIGYGIYALIEIRANLADVERVAEQLAELPETFFVGSCTGGYDVFAAALFRSMEHMHEFMTKRVAKISGIQRTSTSTVTQIVKRAYAHPVQVPEAGTSEFASLIRGRARRPTR